MKRLLLILTLAPVQAGAFDLAWPVHCTLGEDCFVQNYFDHDPGPGSTDFSCGSLVSDGHQGTDIALPTWAAMRQGVAVTAAADGTVRGIRDGMPDIRVTDAQAPPLAGRDCGNGVAIVHDDGWETQYCHMKQGSILVQEGQFVTRGESLGLVGMSGNADFPHLHLSVRHNGDEVDPFDPVDTNDACQTPPAAPLWTDVIPYRPGGIITTDFNVAIPTYDGIKMGLPAGKVAFDDPAIVFWAYLFGARAGDVLVLDITGPDGPIIANRVTLDRTQAQLFRAIGKKRKTDRWPTGQYHGSATLLRQGQIIDTRRQDITIAP
jgi:hypothetical protein